MQLQLCNATGKLRTTDYLAKVAYFFLAETTRLVEITRVQGHIRTDSTICFRQLQKGMAGQLLGLALRMTIGCLEL